jgi:predicted dehydrogenase
MRIDGELGSLSCNDGRTLQLYSESPDFCLGQEPGVQGGQPLEHRIHVPPQDTFLLEVQHFLRCLQTGEQPLTSGRSQRKPLAVVLAAYRSMESGLPERVSL